MTSPEESSLYQIEELKKENARLKQELMKLQAERSPNVIQDVSENEQMKLSGSSQLPASNIESETVKTVPYANVLVAEDEEFIFFFIDEALKISNLNAIHARNGQEAVELVKNNRDIRLILMDGRMPVMSGLEATREIKKIRPEIPIIALSAMAHSTDINDALEAGCADYITKPFEIRVLLDKIALYL